MSNNLANLMVGFGLDLSALQRDAPEAFRILNAQTKGMSAEMKRASREGAESFRLIDEALGIHVSRPLTRILTREFPALASTLQSLMGVGVVGALGVVAFEGYEKAARAIEHAQKAQEEFAKSSRTTKETFEDIMASFDKSEKLRSLSGLGKKLFEIDSATVDETRKKIDELTKALEENAKAAAAAGGWWTKFKAGVGNLATDIFSSPNATNAEKIDAQLAQFKNKIDDLGRIDGLNQTHYSAAAISAELDFATRKLQQLQADEGKTITKPSVGLGAAPQTSLLVSPEEVTAQQRYIDALKELRQVQSGGDLAEGRAENDAKSAAALEESRKAVKEAQFYLNLWDEGSTAAWQTWVHTNEELDKTIAKLNETGTLAESASRFKEFEKINGPIGTVGPPPGAPELADQGELQKVTDDQNESWKKAGQILQEIESPAQKYATQLAILKTLEQEGRLSADQVALATQKLGEEMTKAQLHVQQMSKQLENLLSHSTSAQAGVQAFFLQLSINSAENGKFAFDLLSQGLKGFEDEVTKAIFTGKAQWKDYFRSLAEEAFKFMLNKEIASMFQMLSGTGVGKSLGLDKLIPGAGQAGQSAALTTNTTALATNTTALTTLTARLSVAGTGGGGGLGFGFGGGSSSAGSSGAAGDVGEFASGTDSAPGGFAWVGERGPELVNLPGGSSVTPTESLRSGGDTHQYFTGNVITEDLMKKADFARAMSAAKPALIGEAVANFNEIRMRTAGSGR